MALGSRRSPNKKWYLKPHVPALGSLVSLAILEAAAWSFSDQFPGLSFELLGIGSVLVLLISGLLWTLLYQLLRLHESRENLRLTLESSNDIVFILDPKGLYLEVFTATDEILAVSPLRIRGQSVREVLGHDLGERVERVISEVLATGEKQTVEYSVPIHGKTRSFEAAISKRDVSSVVAAIRDRTREMNLARELEQQRVFTESILNSISDPIFIKDDQHRWVYGNDAFSALLGKPRGEYYGKTDDEFYPAEIAKPFVEADVKTFNQMKEFEQEESFINVKGQRRVLLTKKTPFVDLSGKKNLIGVIRDITERKDMERQIADERARQVAAARLASLGEMAGGVAHEINNPLAIISGYASRLTDVISAEPIDRTRALEISDRIDKTISRIASIIKGLRSIARDGSSDAKEILPVAAIVSETLGMCSERFRNQGVRVETRLETDLFVRVRSVQISQVLLNLLTNAFYAASNSEEARIGVQTSRVEDHVEIVVSDSGSGVPEEIRERIFEPFFTTKPVGLGTGLGLSIAASIVREHDGELLLDTESLRTRFIIRLPAV